MNETGGLVRVLLPLGCPPRPGRPQVLALAPLPGVLARAVLLVPGPRTDDHSGGDVGGPQDRGRAALELARAERHLLDSPPGTFATRQRALQDGHPRLWAARHLVLAVGRVVGALLGLAVLLQLLIRPVLDWLGGLLSGIDWPGIPWPDMDLPVIPWPDLPHVGELPVWFVALMDTTKYWVPIVAAVFLAMREVRRRSRRSDSEEARR